MKKATCLASIAFALTVLSSGVAHAQDEIPSRVEVGVQFSSVTSPRESVFGAPAVFTRTTTEAGFGGRITFNLNKNIALEAEQNYFPHENVFNDSRGGTLWQGHFGVKVGKRFGKFGVFGKARPGFASFSRAITQVDTQTFVDSSSGQTFSFPIFGVKRQTHFAMDLGGVIEFYPSRKVLTRIDVGDTIIPNGNETFVPAVTSFQRITKTTHSLQISAGIGFRFGSLAPEETTPQAHDEKLQRYEVGAQFSSLGLQVAEHNLFTGFPSADFRETITLAGFGGRFTLNLTPNFALEAQGDFYPQDNFLVNNGRAGGKTLQLQAGLKAGKRFEKFGVFAKGRPGVVSFSQTIEIDGFDPTFGFPIFRIARQNYFSLDVGGVLEFYPMRRVFARFDGGDTMIFYRGFDQPFTFFPVQVFHVPSEVRHNFQFSAGVGFRF